jgi:hypothetical protein
MAEELSRTKRHEMSECKVLYFADGPPAFGNAYGTGFVRCRCETHGIECGTAMKHGQMCSIGLIEKAALEAVEQITLAAREALK